MNEFLPMTRRTMLAACGATLPALIQRPAYGAEGRSDLGLVIHSFPVRIAREKRGGEPISAPLPFLAYARTLGVDGVQVGIGARSEVQARAIREYAQAASMFLEGIVSLPRDDTDLARFEAEILTAKLAGATVVRTVMLSGRRYETFTTAAAFKRAAEASFQMLTRAAPIVSREKVRLAVENHKDFRSDEFLALLKKVGNDDIGVCLDLGNNIALLEDPMEVVEALAPLAFTTHLKDMGVEESRDGFLLAEVALGTGVLDLPRMAKALRAVRPEARLVIEMITRDPLSVPCLTDQYWATMADVPARHLARTLTQVRDHPPTRPLDRVSLLNSDAQLERETRNVHQCIEFSRKHLKKS